MVKTNLIILEHEDKSSGGYDRTRFKCEHKDGSTKWMSAFRTTDEEKKIVESLKANEKKLISVEVEEKPNSKDASRPFFNITKFHELVKDATAEVIKPENVGVKSVDKLANAYAKDPVGLAVEVFCTLREQLKGNKAKEVMEISIDLVKQAQKAFE